MPTRRQHTGTHTHIYKHTYIVSLTHTHTHTHTHIYIYIYMRVWVCVCVCVSGIVSGFKHHYQKPFAPQLYLTRLYCAGVPYSWRCIIRLMFEPLNIFLFTVGGKLSSVIYPKIRLTINLRSIGNKLVTQPFLKHSSRKSSFFFLLTLMYIHTIFLKSLTRWRKLFLKWSD